MCYYFINNTMKLLYMPGLKKKKSKKTTCYTENQQQREALIQTARQQFIKLQELGLKIPIAVL